MPSDGGMGLWDEHVAIGGVSTDELDDAITEAVMVLGADTGEQGVAMG